MNATQIQLEYKVFMTQYSESLAEKYEVHFEDISMFQMVWKRASYCIFHKTPVVWDQSNIRPLSMRNSNV